MGRRRSAIRLSLGRSTAVRLSRRGAVLRLALRRTVALRRRPAVLLRGRASVVLMRTAVLPLGRRCAGLRRRLLLWVRWIGWRLATLLLIRRRLSATVRPG